MLLFFLFKQKTAYEMRISDWSSDVCSSDLKDILLAEEDPDDVEIFEMALEELKPPYPISHAGNGEELLIRLKEKLPYILFLDIGMPCKDGIACIEEIRDRNSVVTGKRVSVEVELDVRRIKQKKNK